MKQSIGFRIGFAMALTGAWTALWSVVQTGSARVPGAGRLALSGILAIHFAIHFG
jgi:hypothetical protein